LAPRIASSKFQQDLRLRALDVTEQSEQIESLPFKDAMLRAFAVYRLRTPVRNRGAIDRAAQDIAKAIGGRYRRVRAADLLSHPETIPGIRVTPEMRASILEGQPLMEQTGSYGTTPAGDRRGPGALPGGSESAGGEGNREPALDQGTGSVAALAGGHLPAGDLERRAVAALERGAPIATVLGRSDIGAIVTRREDPTPYLVSTGIPPLAAGANRRLGLGLQARVHPRLVFQQGYAFTGLAPRNP
jgi:hypothetical protein